MCTVKHFSKIVYKSIVIITWFLLNFSGTFNIGHWAFIDEFVRMVKTILCKRYWIVYKRFLFYTTKIKKSCQIGIQIKINL